MMPEIIRIKIYDADMRVIWSDEQRLIGRRFDDNPQFVAAIAGATTVNLKHTTGSLVSALTKLVEGAIEGH